ncbi:MAG: hypothetical protein LBS19_04580, partial [Clostridiales bacterium]|nr:hypothetical protein [Clostridiales bacterium]
KQDFEAKRLWLESAEKDLIDNGILNENLIKSYKEIYGYDFLWSEDEVDSILQTLKYTNDTSNGTNIIKVQVDLINLFNDFDRINKIMGLFSIEFSESWSTNIYTYRGSVERVIEAVDNYYKQEGEENRQGTYITQRFEEIFNVDEFLE